MLSIGDRGALLSANTVNPSTGRATYSARVVPAVWRYIADLDARDRTLMNGPTGDPTIGAAGNLFDPLLTVLSILQTKGIPSNTVRADDKLQRARLKSGKKPIPPHVVVDTAPYVTALLARGKPRGDGLGGTHASPRWHLRRGTIRTYPSGKQSIIFDTLVNVDPEVREAFKSGKLDIIGARASYDATRVKP